MAAHDNFMKGRELLFGVVSDGQMFEAAKTYFQNAIDLDADYSTAYAGLAMAHMFDFQNGWSGSGVVARDKAEQLSELAITKDNDDFFAHYVAAVVAMFKNDLDRTATEADKSLKLNPISAWRSMPAVLSAYIRACRSERYPTSRRRCGWTRRGASGTCNFWAPPISWRAIMSARRNYSASASRLIRSPIWGGRSWPRRWVIPTVDRA